MCVCVCVSWVGVGVHRGPETIRQAWQGMWREGPLLICPNEALRSLGSLPGPLVRGSCQAAQRGPKGQDEGPQLGQGAEGLVPRQGSHAPRAPSPFSHLPWDAFSWPCAPFCCRVLPDATPWPLPLLTAPPHPKVLDQDTDAIAVHVVRVLTCIMSGSPSAKVRTPSSACSRGVGCGLN